MAESQLSSTRRKYVDTPAVSGGADFTGDMRFINGGAFGSEIYGNVSANGPLKVEETGIIHGNIEARSSELHGSVHGDVSVTGHLAIGEGSQLKGRIKSETLDISSDVSFTGQMSIGESVKDLPLGKTILSFTTQFDLNKPRQ